MIKFTCRLFGDDVASEVGPPNGQAGNEWDESDFAGHETPLAVIWGPESVAFCVQQGTCELNGEVLDKFKEIMKKYPLPEEDDDEYDAQDHFAVLVRQGLIVAGLVPPGDPERYQYKIAMGFIHYAD